MTIACPVESAAGARLFIPLFSGGPGRETHLLVASAETTAVPVEFWAFSAAGQLLGQFQVWLRPRESRALATSDAFRMGSRTTLGWIGVVSPSDRIQLAYSSHGDGTAFVDAVTAGSRQVVLDAVGSGQSVYVTNPNPTGTDVVLRSMDAAGAFLQIEEIRVGPFSVLSSPVLPGGVVSSVGVTANQDVFAGLHETDDGAEVVDTGPLAAVSELELVIESDEAIGAYQVTLRFDPAQARFSPGDIGPGSTPGFDTTPLVVNIDNDAGVLTIGSFQVGREPSGGVAVASLRVGPATRFDIEIDEITNTVANRLETAPRVGLFWKGD